MSPTDLEHHNLPYALSMKENFRSDLFLDGFSLICKNLGMEETKITITVKLFAAYQEVCGVSEMQMEFPTGTPVVAVRDRLITEHPQLSEWQNLTRFGLNLQFVEPDTLLQNGDEVVLIPPVSGG